jgi:hypothetical protein
VDFKDLKEGMAGIKDIADFINESKRDSENKVKLATIDASLVGEFQVRLKYKH